MPTEDSRAIAKAEVRAVIEDWMGALRAKDARGVVVHHAQDFVQFSFAPPLVADVADSHGLEAWFATWDGPLDYELCHLRVTGGEDTAFCHSLTRLRGTKRDGTKHDIWFRHTLGFRKIDGAWKITHEHESVPFYMDGSYRAAIDLEPSITEAA